MNLGDILLPASRFCSGAVLRGTAGGRLRMGIPSGVEDRLRDLRIENNLRGISRIFLIVRLAALSISVVDPDLEPDTEDQLLMGLLNPDPIHKKIDKISDQIRIRNSMVP